MKFPIDIKKLNIEFTMGSLKVKVIDANHGAFKQSFPRHMHSFYELHYVTGGKGMLVTDSGSFALGEGTLYLTEPKINHEQLSDKNEPLEEYHFSFELKPVKGAKQDNCCDALRNAHFWHGEEKHGIKSVFEELERETGGNETGQMLAIKNCFERILIITARNISGKVLQQPVLNMPDDMRYALIDDAFLYSYKTITVESLAKLLGLSYRQTQRLVKEKYSMGFSEYKTKSRLNAASNFLIMEQKYTIEQITEMVGFSNSKYFTALFKKQFGVTPSQYRNSHRI